MAIRSGSIRHPPSAIVHPTFPPKGDKNNGFLYLVFDFLEINIIFPRGRLWRNGLAGRGVSSALLPVHFFMYIPEIITHLPGGTYNRKQEAENKAECQVNQECVK
jgi:hypothetical protein